VQSALLAQYNDAQEDHAEEHERIADTMEIQMEEMKEDVHAQLVHERLEQACKIVDHSQWGSLGSA